MMDETALLEGKAKRGDGYNGTYNLLLVGHKLIVLEELTTMKIKTSYGKHKIPTANYNTLQSKRKIIYPITELTSSCCIFHLFQFISSSVIQPEFTSSESY